MNTLKEILVDAARYRWLKENILELEYWLDEGVHLYPREETIDAFIDRKLSSGQ